MTCSEPILLFTGANVFIHIFILGHSGTGKTSSIALLAVRFGEGSQQLQHFDFVFAIKLNLVNKTSSVAEIIKLQHDRFKAMDVSLDHIESILKGTTKHRVLLLVDGYDEYTRGTNRYIDTILESRSSKVSLILTSRPGDYVPKEVSSTMHGETIIVGFSWKKIVPCCVDFLGSSEKADKMIQEARKSEIDDLLFIPIILLMTCVIFAEKKSLPKTKTGIIGTISELMMDRSTMKSFGCKSSQLKHLQELLDQLGELAWQALQKDSKQFLLRKVRIFFCTVRLNFKLTILYL